MTSLMNALRSAWWSLPHRLGLIDILDILIVAIIAYQLLMLTRQTRGSAVLKGLVLLLLAVWLSSLTGLTALNWLLTGVINNGALVLVILFQPELRKALEQIGRGAHLERTRADDAEESASIPDEIMVKYYRLASTEDVSAIDEIERELGSREVDELVDEIERGEQEEQGESGDSGAIGADDFEPEQEDTDLDEEEERTRRRTYSYER